MKPTKYFRTTTNEYCHITDDTIFIFNTKEPTRIPLEHEVSDAWGIKSVLNYIFFAMILLYTMFSVSYYGAQFFTQPLNYGALLLLFLSFVKIKEGFISSSTPTIQRSKIRSVHFKSPKFSYPRVVIYFEGPEGKVLRRSISVKYRQEGLQILKETGLVQ
ncbi:MAG: hypothetical protein A3K10_05355 [Bacteroidetes bacterium RIFCSPLOWO2_12_FULL_31_6]|nr:MAG: hypothetical protein A3K10_05355 [Bacteroidetes bacterium RIFCSPLOWO2_12_FULL_31_6]